MTADQTRAGEIVLDAVAPFVVGVFTKRYPAQMDWTFATGTGIVFKGRKLLLTAAHVLSENTGDQPADLVFLPKPEGGFKISKSLDGGLYPRSQRWHTSRVIGERHTDLAAVSFSTAPEIAFFAIEDDLTMPPAPGRPVAMCGYPKAKSKTVQLGSIVTDLALPDFQGASVIEVPGMQPFQFAIDYPNMTGVVLPGGYSGAMVWYDKANCGTVDQMQHNLRLGAAGIVTEHDPEHNALKCTHINAIVRFLRHIR
ncbi:MAG TPA: trypsin-like peptidase domain-containing protein [Bryobacteraceae bacterium]|jgi:hypothetical protein|nr:trypsin-like peptidase domain-containing protein [Bryobacteraceae bacterium]